MEEVYCPKDNHPLSKSVFACIRCNSTCRWRIYREKKQWRKDMTKNEAQDIAVKFVHDVYQRQMENDALIVAELCNQSANMRETGDCAFYVDQLLQIRKFIDELITTLKYGH